MPSIRAVVPGVLALALLGCSARPGVGESESESTGEAGTLGQTQTGDPTPTTSTTPPTTVSTTSTTSTTIPTTTDATTSTSTTGVETTTEGDTTTTTTAACDMVSASSPSTSATTAVGTTDGECADPQGQANDSPCQDPSGCGCASGKCFLIPILGGTCGECLGDADCGGGGCTMPNPLAMTGARCNKGEPGAGCQSDEVCKDPAAPLCKLTLTVPGIIDVATCSECRSNSDCPDPAAHNCSPIYDIAGFGGRYVCRADGAAENNGGCDLADCMGAPIGDRVCASGLCGKASIMGVLDLGICGACRTDRDCPPGLSCTPAEVDTQNNQLIGATCQ